MESPEDVQAAWGAEIERRARRVLSGESAGESWEDVRNRIARPSDEALMLRLRAETEASVGLAEAALWYERQRIGLGLEFVDTRRGVPCRKS